MKLESTEPGSDQNLHQDEQVVTSVNQLEEEKDDKQLKEEILAKLKQNSVSDISPVQNAE